MRAAARSAALPPSLPAVPRLLRLSRCQYAQLAQQRFAPPHGRSRGGGPVAAAASAPGPLQRAAELGLKLTAAAEMLCARFAPADSDGSSGEPGAPPASEAALARDPGWQRFVASLDARGYWQGNIPGSQRRVGRGGGTAAVAAERVLLA
jgi:hypothetical protein